MHEKHLFHAVPHRVIRCCHRLRFNPFRCHCRKLNIYYNLYFMRVLLMRKYPNSGYYLLSVQAFTL